MSAIVIFFVDKYKNENFTINPLPNGLSDHDAQLLVLNNTKIQNPYFIDLPLKMEPIQCSETSAINTETPGKHPKEIIFHSKSIYLSYNQRRHK
jgi:hypothetical protein